MYLMNKNLEYFLYTIAGILAFVIITFIIIGIVKIIKTKNMYKEVFNTLNSYASNKEMTVSKVKTFGFDYLVEEKTKLTYIKVIPNFFNFEININNKYMWQIRKSFSDNDLFFVPDIEIPMRANFKDSTKPVQKIFIIYPSAKQLLYALNECEYEFVYHNTNIYGAKVMTYTNLKYLIDRQND